MRVEDRHRTFGAAGSVRHFDLCQKKHINDGSVPFKYPSEPKLVSQHAQYQSHGSDSSKWTPCFSNISYISVWQVKMSTERKVYYQGII